MIGIVIPQGHGGNGSPWVALVAVIAVTLVFFAVVAIGWYRSGSQPRIEATARDESDTLPKAA